MVDSLILRAYGYLVTRLGCVVRSSNEANVRWMMKSYLLQKWLKSELFISSSSQHVSLSCLILISCFKTERAHEKATKTDLCSQGKQEK
jgi:hypothetical protein